MILPRKATPGVGSSQSGRPRSRFVYGSLTIAAVALGLASRNPQFSWPLFIKEYAGDTLWAAMAFFAAAAIWARARTWSLAAAVALFSLAIELSQLWQVQWLNTVRDTRIGGLILGHGFLWSDLACYTAGIGLAATIDWLLLQRRGCPDEDP